MRTNQTDRRSWFDRTKAFCVVAAMALPAGMMAAQPAAAQTDVRVGKSSAETFAFSPVHVGLELGIFEEHGLNVSIADFGGGARLQQGMAAGAVDIGLGSGPELASIAKGNPAKGVAMFMGPPAMLVLLANADDPDVQTAEDLEGGTVAVTQIGSLTAYLTQRLSAGLGWGPDGIQLVALGDDRSRLAALRTNQVDAIVINTATALQLEKEGVGTIVARFGEYVTPFHNHVMYATNDFIEQEPEAVRAFIEGWMETIEWMRENPEETVEMTKDIQGVDTDIGLAVFDEAMPAFSSDLRFDGAAMDLLSESWVENGTLDEEPDLSTLYTEEFLPQ